MQKITCFALGLFISMGAFAQTWTLDKAHSQLNFNITHLTISSVEGGFKSVSATLTSSKDDLSDASIELDANVNSISTGVEARDNHLKSDAFFNAAKDSLLTFKSTSFTQAGGKNYTLTGNLTLHGVTKSVTLNVVFNGTVVNPMSKKTVAGFKITGVIKRSDFNIGSTFPATMLSDEVNLDANAEFTKGS
jgi:polyisoprenoid-binding protein YceI